ncbi:MAG: hypothetical protein GWP19_10875 [Planctomycetia bacterium]|nr:hypothetical protein [Planctomycetia bacterium]
MIKKAIFLLIIFSFGFSQTTLYGLDGWYHISAVATAGGAGAVPNLDSDRINPAGFARLPKQIQLSLVMYPANINAQSAMFVTKLKKHNIGIGVRHLNYGNFISTNEYGIENGTYTAGDTWLNAVWAQSNKNLSWGVTGGIFLSNLETYNAAAIVFSTGVLYDYVKKDIQMGISLSNFGMFLTRYTNQKDKLPTKIIISANKGLVHLPLDLNIDIGFSLYYKKTTWRFGGVFILPYGLQLAFGINSNTITQRTGNNLANEIFGSSGLGIKYTYKQYSIEIGGYMYGTGSWIYGTGFNFKF